MDEKERSAKEIVLLFFAIVLVCIYVLRWQKEYTEFIKGSRVQGFEGSSGVVHLTSRPLNPLSPVVTSGEAKQVLGIKIDINKASQQNFESLPNIGPKLAKTIIEKRAELNGFKSIDDIKMVKGIGEKKFEKIKGLIEVK